MSAERPEKPGEREIESGTRRLGRSLGVVGPVIAATLIMAYGFADVIEQAWPLAADVSYGFTDDVQSRIRDAGKQQPEVEAANTPRLSVVIGASSMREAVIISAFNQTLGPERNVMGLCGAGASLQVIEDYMQRLQQSSLNPDHVVIGLGPYLFNDNATPFREARLIREGRETSTDSQVQEAPWTTRILAGLSERQTQVSLRAELGLRALRERLQDPEVAAAADADANPFGFDLSSRDPFREVLHMFGNVSDEVRQKRVNSRLAIYKQRDYFQLPSYDAMEQIGRPLTTLIQRWLDNGVPVTVIFLPEHSVFRERMPENIPSRVSDNLNDATAGHPGFRLVDLRDRLPDEAFWDLVHLTPRGREQLVPILTPLIIPPEP